MKQQRSFLRSLSSWIPARSAAVVAPLPIRSQFDELVTAELDALIIPQTPSDQCSTSSSSSSWLLNVLDASTTTQKIALQSLNDVVLDDSDRIFIEECLDNNAKLLDNCNELNEKIEMIRQYIESSRVASHSLQRNFSNLSRAEQVSDSCEEMEKKIAVKSFINSKPSIKNVGKDKLNSRVQEVLNGSQSVASMECSILWNSLELKSRNQTMKLWGQVGAGSGWSWSLHELHKQLKDEGKKRTKTGSSMTLSELQLTVMAARKLRDLVKCRSRNEEIKMAAEELTMRCGDLEGNILCLEKGVKDLYKHLISVRMCLLGILSQA